MNRKDFKRFNVSLKAACLAEWTHKICMTKVLFWDDGSKREMGHAHPTAVLPSGKWM